MAAWPAVTVWVAGCVVIEGVTGTPAPAMAIVAIWMVTTGAIGVLAMLTGGVSSRLLVIERLPETLPVAVGAKLVMKVVLCPPANVNGSGGPFTVKPPPDAIVWETVMVSVPEFVRVRLCLLIEPTATFPKLRLLGFATRSPDDVAHPDRVRAANNAVASRKKIVR